MSARDHDLAELVKTAGEKIQLNKKSEKRTTRRKGDFLSTRDHDPASFWREAYVIGGKR